MDDFSGSRCLLWDRGLRDRPQNGALPLPLVLIPAGLPSEIRVQESVVLVFGHGTESFFPSLSRSLCGTNHNLCVLNFEFYFCAKTALLEEDLGYAHTLRIADFNDTCLHRVLSLSQEGDHRVPPV